MSLVTSVIDHVEENIFSFAANVNVKPDRSAIEVGLLDIVNCLSRFLWYSTFTVEAIHVSCSSDEYRGTRHSYGGIIASKQDNVVSLNIEIIFSAQVLVDCP